MKPVVPTFCFFLFSLTLLQGKQSELKSPLGTLSEEVLTLFPEDSKLIVNDSKGFAIHYKTREFMVHNVNIVGQISEKAKKVTGPSYQGMIFRVNMLRQNAVIQAVTPQSLRKPYWTSYINHLNFEGYSLFYAIEYGSRSDRKLIHTITTKLNSLPGITNSRN